MKFHHPVTDLIGLRCSIRDYAAEPIAPHIRTELEEACRSLSRGPFGTECRFQIVERSRVGLRGSAALGTYGMIRGSQEYLVGAARRSTTYLEDYGFLFEQLILKATDLGLSTCWLGGTFNRSGFAHAIALGKVEILPAVSPVGYAARRRSGRDRFIRWFASSKRRKAWEQLFFDGELSLPLTQAQAGEFALALEMVRLAPSASNRQPWRILRRQGAFHLFLQRTPGYRRLTGLDLQRLDMGIAMAHFALILEELQIPGRWLRAEPAQWESAATAASPGLRYVASWVPEA